jgi:hypothetical protein
MLFQLILTIVTVLAAGAVGFAITKFGDQAAEFFYFMKRNATYNRSVAEWNTQGIVAAMDNKRPEAERALHELKALSHQTETLAPVSHRKAKVV